MNTVMALETSSRSRMSASREEALSRRLATAEARSEQLHDMGAPFLFVIAHHDYRRFDFVRRHFGEEPEVGVVIDRRGQERRGGRAPVPIDRRHQDRRQHDVSGDLQAIGWAYVRRADPRHLRPLARASA